MSNNNRRAQRVPRLKSFLVGASVETIAAHEGVSLKVAEAMRAQAAGRFAAIEREAACVRGERSAEILDPLEAAQNVIDAGGF